jgi:ferritin heavy chain
VNDQVRLELEAMYTYLSMANFFDRSDEALMGFSRYFSKAAHEEMRHVETLSRYQNKRGGSLRFGDIKKPSKEDWGSGECLPACMHACIIIIIRV